MDHVVLSLKSIYMLLVSEDFPDYSGSVIARSERKGLTMLRFWQGMLSPEFREQPCGQMLWRSDGKRNRYTSYLCNRSGEIRNYSLYARELSARLSRDSLGAQIALFTDFLSARKYRHDILLQRVRMLTELARKEDPGFGGHGRPYSSCRGLGAPRPGGAGLPGVLSALRSDAVCRGGGGHGRAGHGGSAFGGIRN